jgi:branched-chain amino acid transport system substrate-binding protein
VATKSLLTAVAEEGTTNNIKVIKRLEQLKVSAKDRMQHDDAWMNPQTHQMQQTVYMATANTGTQDTDDMFRIVSHSKPDEVADASATASAKLESYEDTPTYET